MKRRDVIILNCLYPLNIGMQVYKYFLIPKPVWAVGFALEQTLHVVALAVFSFLILKRLQHITMRNVQMLCLLLPFCEHFHA
ncbi:MAG: hypothetical protein LBH59_00505 [Planctomycetaceae bacterium]|nr:hypothetical protein [Planctomycetaceae bacterium]